MVESMVQNLQTKIVPVFSFFGAFPALLNERISTDETTRLVPGDGETQACFERAIFICNIIDQSADTLFRFEAN